MGPAHINADIGEHLAEGAQFLLVGIADVEDIELQLRVIQEKAA
jgi:hypothetical protein